MSYYNWLVNQNMSTSEERCVIMDTERFECTDTCEYPDGNWIVVSCTETHPYMCKQKKGLDFLYVLINRIELLIWFYNFTL